MPERGLQGTRILLVEDATDIRDVFTILLEAEGAQVVATASGKEAADLAGRHDFDLLLTDLGLPDIPGDVLVRQVLSASRRRPRVIVVTGFDEPFVCRARQAGADAVFTKPVAWNVLLEQLRPAHGRRLAA
jgi:DNA-binding response OmpR family regulator